MNNKITVIIVAGKRQHTLFHFLHTLEVEILQAKGLIVDKYFVIDSNKNLYNELKCLYPDDEIKYVSGNKGRVYCYNLAFGDVTNNNNNGTANHSGHILLMSDLVGMRYNSLNIAFTTLCQHFPDYDGVVGFEISITNNP